MSQPCHVYVLREQGAPCDRCDERCKDAIRYVGITHDLVGRLKEHLRRAQNGTHKNKHLENLIKKILRSGNSLVLDLRETFSDGKNHQGNRALAGEAEQAEIKVLLAKGCKLVNLTSGGEAGYEPSDETRKKLSVGGRAYYAKWRAEGKENPSVAAFRAYKAKCRAEGKEHPSVTGTRAYNAKLRAEGKEHPSTAGVRAYYAQCRAEGKEPPSVAGTKAYHAKRRAAKAQECSATALKQI